MAFPSAELLESQSQFDERSKSFVVEHEGYIQVPGLITLDAVAINGLPMELNSMRPFSKQDPGKEVEYVQVEQPIVALQSIPGLGPVLVRSLFSNDGKWQIGATVVVTGDWADAPVEHFVSSVDLEAEKKARADALAAKDAKIAELQKQLEESKASAPAASGAPAAESKPDAKGAKPAASGAPAAESKAPAP